MTLRDAAARRRPGMVGARRALALAWVLAACAPRSGVSTGERPAGNSTPVPIEVESHNWRDVVIYLVRGGQPQRIGMVTGLSTTEFVIPFRRLGSSGNARLFASPIGGGPGYTSETLLVQPGQMIKLILDSDLGRSSTAVY